MNLRNDFLTGIEGGDCSVVSVDNSGMIPFENQAYANAKDSGVVYDLSWYKNELGVNNPFISFISYFEKITKPNMVDNSYSIEVSNFIKNKCENCKDVMIVGDDFVVPGYRREIPTLTRNWFFWTEEDVKNIYTDIPYTKKTMLYLSDYKEIFRNTDVVATEGKYEGKDVLFILPDSITSEQRTQVERLKKVFDDKGYKPDYSEMRGKDTFCLDERWFVDVKGKTLIIIGTEENNNAFKCMPFVAGDANRDTAFMQPNVWDTEEYALVINTDNPDIIGALANLVETGEIIDLKSESAYFFKVGVTYASYAALGVGVGSLILFSGGTAAPVTLLAASQVLEFIADAGDVADTCTVNPEGVGWCGGTIALAALPFVPSKVVKKPIKGFADAVSNSELKKLLEPFEDLIKKYFKKLRNSKAIGNLAFERAVKTPQDNIYMAKGAKRFIGDDFNKLDTLPFSKIDNAHFIKTVGKAEEVFAIKKEIEVSFGVLPYNKAAVSNGKRIIINKNLNELGENIDEVIPHEYAHTKIFEDLGDKWPGSLVTPDKIKLPRESTLEFEEFLANDLAKSKVPEFTIQKLDSITDVVTAKKILDGMDYDKIAKHLAYAKKHDSQKYYVMLHALATYNPKVEQIMDLADTFVKYEDYTKLTNEAMDEIAEKTTNLMGW